jgi:hypothetical protein
MAREDGRWEIKGLRQKAHKSKSEIWKAES